MVDFSLTAADERVLAQMHTENELGRKYAREHDRIREHEPARLHGTHDDVVHLEAPYEMMERVADEGGTSGAIVLEAMMRMVSAADTNMRDDPHEAFGSGILNEWGSPEQKERYGHKKFSIGLSEPGAGSDPAAMRSTARYDPATDEYVLNGEKVFISFINKFDGAVTLVKELGGDSERPRFTAFIVEKALPGFHEAPQMKKLGIRKHDIAGFSMQDVRVPAIARLDVDFARTMSRFNHNRPIIAAIAIGSCRSMLDFTAEKLGVPDYAKGLAGRSAVEDKLIRMEALWQAAWGTIMRAKWKEQQLGEASYDYRTEASMAKALGARVARQITQGCLELLGPEGLSESYFAEKWFRDVRIADIYEGAGEVQRILVARDVLGYKRELN